LIISKIKNHQGMKNLQEIIEVSDGIMVAFWWNFNSRITMSNHNAIRSFNDFFKFFMPGWFSNFEKTNMFLPFLP